MRALSRILVPVLLVLSQGISHAEERERILCDPGNPDTQCPGESCRCIDDTLEVTFEGKVESVLTVASSDVGSRVAVIVVSGTKSTPIQGWSYGVHHDARFLGMDLATMEDTDAKAAFRGGFEVTTADGVEECEEVVAGSNPCASPRPGGGWIQAVVLSLGEAVELPVKRNSLARAEYTLKELPPDAGTLIAVTEKLRRFSSPPVAINLTRMGQSRRPRHVVDGWIRGSGGPPPELCANALDDDGDGSTDCEDADCLGSVVCGPPPEICGNGKDDDRDGVPDCLDAECVDAKVPCTEVCGNRKDDDTDGKVDCFDDDCDGNSFCVPRDEECNNVWDDDRDGDTDCEDSDCLGELACLEVCGNDRDDDLDGKADCQDDDCRGNAVCVEDCENGQDDDFDGKSDCADEECAGPGCQEICGNRRDDDRDGWFDCYDEDCAAEEACVPKQEICNNREDEDFDSLTDCEDPECKDEVWCNPRDEICGNRWDDDFDRKIDCGDEDCVGDTVCKEAPEEDCENTRDDDLDLLVDCKDDDCWPSAPNCSAARENCGNARDDDGDGRTDCNDEDCSVDAACQGGGAGGFIRGDVDGNMRLNVIDAILSVPVTELAGRRDCSDAQDADDDGRLTVLDTVTLLTYLFQRGPDLAAPGGRCGVDGTGDTLACRETACP